MRSIPPLLFVVLLSLAAPPAARAAGASETYIFSVTRVELAKGIPKDLEKQVSGRLARAIDDHPDIDPNLPDGAPDPTADQAAFKAFLKKHHQRAFKVNVAVTEYTNAIEPGKAQGKVVTVRVALKIFGETIPDRVMAFTGEGSATVKIEVGKQVRASDHAYANDQALELAVADALKTSLTRLREPPPSQKKKRPHG